MLLYDITELKFNGAIIDTAASKLLFYRDESGAMVLSATLKDSNGRVFFTTDNFYLQLFTTNKISLQFLFESTAASMVTIEQEGECKLYMRSDAEIQLCEGEKIFVDFKDNNINKSLLFNLQASK
jgi:hypothetical protein